jgi:hypothetical protein
MRAWRPALFLSLLPWTVAANDVIVARPEYRVGDAWTYERLDKLRLEKTQPERSRYTIEVVRVSEGEIEMRTPRQRLIFTPEMNLSQRGTVKFEPFILWRRFPLKAGDTWTGRHDFQPANPSARRMHSQLRGEAVGWETVTVPAGTFRCLNIAVRIDSLGMAWGGASGSFSREEARTECWSPEIKRFVRMEYQNFWAQRAMHHEIHELIEFKPGR